MTNRRMFSLGLLGITASFALAATQAPAQRADLIAGTWDLFWQTKRGPEQKGYLVVTQNGDQLRAEIHGRGEISAHGTASGHAFALRGSRMMVTYRIDGQWQGDRLQGTLRVLSVERRFTGVRRGRR